MQFAEEIYKNRKKEKQQELWSVCVRIELTALALSAPHSAHWANGPDKIVKNAEAWYHADGGGYFRPQKAEEHNTLHYLHNSTNIADFNIFSIIHLKHF